MRIKLKYAHLMASNSVAAELITQASQHDAAFRADLCMPLPKLTDLYGPDHKIGTAKVNTFNNRAEVGPFRSPPPGTPTPLEPIELLPHEVEPWRDFMAESGLAYLDSLVQWKLKNGNGEACKKSLYLAWHTTRQRCDIVNETAYVHDFENVTRVIALTHVNDPSQYATVECPCGKIKSVLCWHKLAPCIKSKYPSLKCMEGKYKSLKIPRSDAYKAIRRLELAKIGKSSKYKFGGKQQNGLEEKLRGCEVKSKTTSPQNHVPPAPHLSYASAKPPSKRSTSSKEQSSNQVDSDDITVFLRSTLEDLVLSNPSLIGDIRDRIRSVSPLSTTVANIKLIWSKIYKKLQLDPLVEKMIETSLQTSTRKRKVQALEIVIM
jgi:hypothetical protein